MPTFSWSYFCPCIFTKKSGFVKHKNSITYRTLQHLQETGKDMQRQTMPSNAPRDRKKIAKNPDSSPIRSRKSAHSDAVLQMGLDFLMAVCSNSGTSQWTHCDGRRTTDMVTV